MEVTPHYESHVIGRREREAPWAPVCIFRRRNSARSSFSETPPPPRPSRIFILGRITVAGSSNNGFFFFSLSPVALFPTGRLLPDRNKNPVEIKRLLVRDGSSRERRIG